jgi:hypothetical protein
MPPLQRLPFGIVDRLAQLTRAGGLGALLLAGFFSLGQIGAAEAQTSPSPQVLNGAQQGDANMEWALGHFYLQSTSDHQKAYYWLKKAADAGQMNAKIELGANFSAAGTTPFSAALQSGVMSRAQQAKGLLARAVSDAQLTMVSIDNMSPAQYVFYSLSKQLQIEVLDVHGTLQVGPVVPGTLSTPLPQSFIDLPRAVASAKGQGMQGDIKSAVLMVGEPNGKPPMPVWILTPAVQTARFLSYYVGATDGRPLRLTDISNGINGSDAQLRELERRLHPPAQEVSSGGGQFTSAGHSFRINPGQQYTINQLHAPGNTCAASAAAGCN